MSKRWKRWITSSVAGAVVGIFAGGLAVLLGESAGHALFGTVEPGDLASVTGPMFASVLVAWVLGSAVGGVVATVWTRARSYVPGVVVGLVLLAGAVSNMFVIPHPWWMMIGAVVLMPGAAYLATHWRVANVRNTS